MRPHEPNAVLYCSDVGGEGPGLVVAVGLSGRHAGWRPCATDAARDLWAQQPWASVSTSGLPFPFGDQEKAWFV